MRFRPFALLAALTIVATTACSEDPTEPGNQEPLAIVTNFSQVVRAPGTKFTITAYAIDKNNARLTGRLDATASGGAIAIDSMPYFPELQETRLFVHAISATDGATVTVSGHGLTKDVIVVVE